ncbi:hypothetical protein Gogos_004290 [Gossypium gossypioides]|uniref:DUF4283 domain-containing protein n=1 Tax=Gossypium gossypioides TaxID=34282 RepID=A0A7J9CGE3_GOSGO|nr:hypothetical protein [Gossypium gossypioides]
MTTIAMSRDNISLLEEELVHLTVKEFIGRPWLFRRNLVLLKTLEKSIDRSNIRLIQYPFWLKIGPYPPEFDKQDLSHAIGSTFGGVISSELMGEFLPYKSGIRCSKAIT